MPKTAHKVVVIGHRNPMDINANYSEEDNPLSLKADFILSLCELVVGGKEGLLPVEKTVIDRCVHLIYRKYFAAPCPENMPILEDLYNALLQQDEKEAHHVATALEIYVKGSLNLFNHRTNVNVNNRIVCYDIKELGKQMKKLGMLIVQDQVWGRVTANRSSGKGALIQYKFPSIQLCTAGNCHSARSTIGIIIVLHFVNQRNFSVGRP